MAGTHRAAEPTGEGDESEGLSRRRLVRLLVALGIGVPVAIEVTTFFGLLRGHRGDQAVGIGDELLPATPQTETVADSAVRGGDDWTYRLTVEVENVAEVPYELTLGPLLLEDGQRVAATAATDTVPPGETATLRADWEIPAAATPAAVRARASWGEESVDERVELASPPVYQS